MGWAITEPSQWDVTVPDAFAESHLSFTATEQGEAAKPVADSIRPRRIRNHFFLLTTETADSWSQHATELVEEVKKRISAVTEDNRETTFMFQRLYLAVQRGNAVSFLSSFPQD